MRAKVALMNTILAQTYETTSKAEYSQFSMDS